MNNIELYWGYLTGEEHLTEEQFADIDFGNPSFDTEFITFDPLASSYFQGKYFRMYEKRFFFPHRSLPSMRSENMLMYEDTSIKIIDPPTDVEAPIGIFICLFKGRPTQIKRAINFLSDKINIRFSPCDFNLEEFYLKLSKTRLKINPISMTISDLRIDELLSGDLEVHILEHETFINNLKTYQPKCQQLKLLVKEVNFQLNLTITIDGKIKYQPEITNLNLIDTIYDVASRSVFTGK